MIALWVRVCATAAGWIAVAWYLSAWILDPYYTPDDPEDLRQWKRSLN